MGGSAPVLNEQTTTKNFAVADGFGSTPSAAVAAVAAVEVAVEAVGESVAASETEEAAGERV